MFKGRNYINGEFVCDREDFKSLNPSTEEVIGVFPQTTPKEVRDAVVAARRAFSSWRKTSRIKRADLFDGLAQIIKSRTESLTKAISLETGKSLNESKAEVVESLHMVQYCFGKGRESFGDVVASEIAERDSYVVRKPKGVVAVITPWNFPLAIAFWNSGPALLEGNTVVFKPSELTPMVGQLIAEMYDEAGFPAGTFNLIHGNAIPGERLVTSEVDHVSFTGSASVGSIVKKTCASFNGKSCTCEMGSKSAVIVFDDADLDIAIPACVNSAFKLSGQRCVSASRILVQRGIMPKFTNQFIDKSSKVTVCDPFSKPSGFSIGPLISDEQMEKVYNFNKAVRESREHVLLDGGEPVRPGYFMKPFVYQSEWEDKSYLKDEVFGPHVAVIPFDDLDDAIRIYNDTEYALAVGVITNDFRKMKIMREECDAGMIYFNLGSIGAESHLPFTGLKKSGYGGGSAAGAFDTVVHKVAVTVNHGDFNLVQGLK